MLCEQKVGCLPFLLRNQGRIYSRAAVVLNVDPRKVWRGLWPWQIFLDVKLELLIPNASQRWVLKASYFTKVVEPYIFYLSRGISEAVNYVMPLSVCESYPKRGGDFRRMY
jgi:hypothetical protein